MDPYAKFDFEGRYVFIDRFGNRSKPRTVTLRLMNNFRLYIYAFPEKIDDIPMCNISSAMKEKLEWANESRARFELPLRQEFIFWSDESEQKIDELINKFNELKQMENDKDTAKEGEGNN